NVVASQIALHRRFGGVVPEIASRQHVLALPTVTAAALREAAMGWREIEGIAVTYGPGLAGPLLVGINFAMGLSLARRIPLFAVNHVEAHVLSVWLETPEPPRLPMVSLVVSGGHTELILVEGVGRYRVLGATVDDAAGEAFDKVGRLLGLPYPGGPSVEKAAGKANGTVTELPRAWLPGTYDFSFSGLKTAVLRLVQTQGKVASPEGAERLSLAEEDVASIAAGFQESVADVLTAKLARAVEDQGAGSAAIVGGVANNKCLLNVARSRLDVELRWPAPGLSTDNAAMIAGAALLNPRPADYDLDAVPSLSLS
ncbi:MAG TPA: tRNA (adenosine(37)-N6)-threonylcarbamoyltransferase complex transferase subunit TsaD, partial [Chloroflexota bacterium]|nr:tRNA (adenosine(37)-N6)-threonylcarbamoyltransferase complex transferase subunit TsaD [Chloroflexota bacterium]